MVVKKKIIVFAKYYLPGYKGGGPIKSVSNIVKELSDSIDFYIVTLDRDSGDLTPYKGISLGVWCDVGCAKVIYLSREEVSCDKILYLIKNVCPDAIYLNSFFDPLFTIKIIALRKIGVLKDVPIVITPRGEFSVGAIRQKKIKKMLYVYMARAFNLYKGIRWQATTRLEQKDMCRVLGDILNRIDISIVPNIPSYVYNNGDNKEDNGKGDVLKVCFLSRIHPIKNLIFALHVLSNVKKPLIFTIYGPIGDRKYWDECCEIMRGIPDYISVKYEQAVKPIKVHSVLKEHNMFFFPTLGENYGHVIIEALLAGLPVLISDRTPWDDLVENGVGWIYSLDSLRPFVEKIEECSEYSPEKWSSLSEKANSYANMKMNIESIVSDNKKYFGCEIFE